MSSLPKCEKCKKKLEKVICRWNTDSEYNFLNNEWCLPSLRHTPIPVSFGKLMKDKAYRITSENPKSVKIIPLVANVCCPKCGRVIPLEIIKKLEAYSKFHTILSKFGRKKP